METKIVKLNTPLTVEEIDFRIQSINKGGYATILAYKDARVDMNRLDLVYGAEGWQKKYDIVNGNLFCSVGIFNDKLQQWIWKQDVGTESNTEKEKGQASDAFKRACFNFGIGRELYDYPVISVKLESNEFKIEQHNGKDIVRQTFDLKLKEWKWYSEFTNGKITYLAAKDNTGNVRFRFGILKNKVKTPKADTPLPYLNENSADFTKEKAHIHQGGTMNEVESRFQVSDTVRELLLNQ